ncbi:MAG TPA: diguanylate cyclase [Holophagaceae bacterium]|nr:diguanylate cyclase [Holophagaceae bacterium]
MSPGPDLDPRRRPWWEVPAVAALVLAAANLLLWRWAEGRRITNEEHIFRGRAELLVHDIQTRVENDADALRALRGFVQAQGTPSPAGWEAFLGSLNARDRYPGIRSFQFDQRVDAAAQEAFDRRAVEEGRPRIWDLPNGRGAAPRTAPVYYPILLTEPPDPAILSFDASSRPEAWAATQAAAGDSGRLALGPPFQPLQSPGARLLPMAAPIFAATPHPPDAAARREALRGFVVLLLDPDAMLKDLGDGALLDYEIRDGEALVHARGGAAGSAGLDLVHHQDLAIHGRTWTVTVRPTAWWGKLGRGESWQVLGSGLAVSLGLLAALTVLAQARERALGLVDRRTRELREANRALLDLATTDPLTGLLNRRAMDLRLAEEEARAAREGTALALVSVDVDFFKHVNDKYGHAMGDAVLRDLGRLLREATRLTDHAARMGGEEFLLLCPNTDATGAAVLAEGLRARFEALVHEEGGERIRVTASFGVSASEPGAPVEAARLLRRSDRALYRAKAEGRNRVEVWVPPVAPAEA